MTKTTHPLDIPKFLQAKNRPSRDEAEVARICAHAATLRNLVVQEDYDPRLLEIIRRGVVSRSILKDPSSIAIALNLIAPAPATERPEKAVKGPAETVSPTRPADHVTPGDIAEALKIDAKLVRRALRSLAEKPAYGWAFPSSEVPSLTKKIKTWIKEQEK